MDICIDVRMALCSGIGTYIRNMVSRLKKGPFRLRLIADPATLDVWKDLADFDLILSKAPYYSIREQVELPFLIPPCDLFWSPHYNIPLLPIRAKKRLVTIHDVYHLVASHTPLKRLYAKTVLSAAARLSDAILTVSHFSRQEIDKYLGALSTPIHVIYPGVDRSRFYPRQGAASMKAKYNLPDQFILFVSNLTPHKNAHSLLAAMTHLSELSLSLVLVGKNKQQPFPPQEGVFFLGHVEEQDLPLLYQLATVLVHPSFYEGFGLTPLEAMSCGCPVVVSQAASLPEVCGDAALYVDPHHPADIARGIKKAVSESASLRIKGLQRSQLFDWDHSVTKLITLMTDLMNFD